MLFKVSVLHSQATTLVDLFFAVLRHLNSVVAYNQKALRKNLPKIQALGSFLCGTTIGWNSKFWDVVLLFNTEQ